MRTQNHRNRMVSYSDVMMDDFLGSLGKLLHERETFSVYYIDLLCSSGAIVGFDYRYEDSVGIVKTIDLKEFGVISFDIDPITGYGKVITEGYKGTVASVLDALAPRKY